MFEVFGQFLIISYVVESFPGADLPLFSSVDSSSAIVMAVLYISLSLFVGSWSCKFSFSFFTLFLYFLNSSSRFSSLDINSYCCARTSALSSLFIANSFVLSFSIGTLIVDFFLMPLILLIWFHASLGFALMFMFLIKLVQDSFLALVIIAFALFLLIL